MRAPEAAVVCVLAAAGVTAGLHFVDHAIFGNQVPAEDVQAYGAEIETQLHHKGYPGLNSLTVDASGGTFNFQTTTSEGQKENCEGKYGVNNNDIASMTGNLTCSMVFSSSAAHPINGIITGKR